MSESDKSPAEVLTQAALRAARLFALTDAELALILGLTEPVIGEMRAGRMALEPASDALRRSALFVGAWIAVDAFLASNDTLSQEWLRRPHPGLCGAPPLELMATHQGLETVRNYTSRLEEPAEYSPLPPQSDLEREVQVRAIEVLGSPAAAAQWLLNAQSSLDGRYPRDVMRSDEGAGEVLRVLDLIDSGEYI